MTLSAHLDGAIFAERRAGEGSPLLVLHGWQRDRRDLLGSLASRDLMAIDLPGFGASPAPVDAWGSAEYADAVARVIDEVGGGPMLVVGHSFGGRIAAHLGADHPECVSGIVFLGAPLLRRVTKTKSPLPYRVVRFGARLGLVSDRRLDAMRQKYGSADYRATRGIMRDVFVRLVNEDYRDQLARLTCPVGFCWGANDTAAPPVIAREAAEVVQNCVALEIVDGAGHDVHRDAPDVLNAVIDAVAGASATATA